MASEIRRLLSGLLVFCVFSVVASQEEVTCYGPGSIAATVFITIIVTLVVLYLLYLILTRYWKKNNDKHLILETDPEKGKGEYAFDNPGFKDTTLASAFNETEKNNKTDSLKTKWSHWSPLSALTAKSEKRTFLDDSVIGKDEIKVVCLRSHDFTGLGFNIFGNMRDGIFIKDILHRGPAFESGKLKSGDCIKSITINFEHIVYEDALTILSYASPYEVIIEAQGEKRNFNPSGQVGHPRHPLFRSSSNTDLVQIGKTAKKRLFHANAINNSLNSSFSSLQKNRSNVTTLERKHSNSPNIGNQKDLLKAQLEQRILEDHDLNLKNKREIIEDDLKKANNKMQKSENKLQKFGIRVLPPQISPHNKEQVSPKTIENSQNDNNANLERNSLLNSVMSEYDRLSIDEVDQKEKKTVQEVKQQEQETLEEPSEQVEENKDISSFDRSPNQSSVRRDENGIPQEIPTHMHNVAMAAKRNRKPSADKMIDDQEGSKTPKKSKGRAPAPPEEKCLSINTNIENGEPECVGSHTEVDGTGDKTYLEKHSDEVFERCGPAYNIDNKHNQLSKPGLKENGKPTINNLNENGISGYALDSDAESDNQSSVNTIALNSSDITIHHIEDNEEIQNRRTASTGDLSKLQRVKKGSGSTLERAQSLDIADTGINLSKKRRSDNLDIIGSDDSVYEKYMMYKEPRLSLVLDGLNTFQRSRLKKSTEWGNLEDAILNLDKDADSEESKPSHQNSSSREFDALVNKINEIKNEDVNTMENGMVNDIAKKDVLHKTYNDLTEIMDDDKSNIMEELSKQHSDRVVLKNLTPYDDVSLLKDTDNDSSIKSDVSLETIDLKISTKEPLLMETTSKLIPKATSPPPDDSLETNGITTSEIEMYLSEDNNLEQKAEPPKRKAKNQIWPTLETQTEKPTVPARKPEPPLRKPEPLLREKNRHPDIESVEKKNENMITVTKVELTTVEEPQPQIISNLTEMDEPITDLETKKCQTTTTITLNSGTNVSQPIEEPAVVPLPPEKTRVQISSRFFKPKLMKEFSENLIIAERLFSVNDPFYNSMDSSTLDLNVSDDMKVSRHSLGNLQTEPPTLPLEKSSKPYENNVSSIMIESPYQSNIIDQLNTPSSLPINDNYVADSDTSMNNTTSLYTTALDQTLTQANESFKIVSDVEIEEEDKNVPVTTPDIIKNITLTEVINTVNTQMSLLDNKPKSLKLQVVGDSESDDNNKSVSKKLSYEEIPVNKSSTVNITDSSDSNDSLTFVTEIRVSPNASVSSNVSDTDTYSVSPSEDPSQKNLENKFESYVKNFETNRKMFGSPVNSTTNYKTESRIPSKITVNSEKNQPEKELQKIHEIVEEQLKKLPEMRFSTSSYESTSKIPEKRSSHIEQIRSNFEKNSNDKSPTKPKAEGGVKSRIPVATQKTPPTSPERRDSRPDSEINSDILELMSSKVQSTPVSSNLRYQPKIPTKNVTVTSIRGNSKIPSGIPGRPPIPTRKPENLEAHSNGNGESSFKQWVFTQSESAVTNIIVDNFKPEQK